MFIDQSTLRRVNIQAPYKGFSRLDTPEIRAKAGVIEIADPARGNDEIEYTQEIDEPPYIVITPKSAEQIAEIRWQKLKQRRDERTINGGVKVCTDWFHSDTHSKVQQLALLMLGANIPANLQWKTMSGAFVTMTQPLAAQLFAAQVAQEQAIFATAEAKRLDTSDVDAGWPETYVEPQA